LLTLPFEHISRVLHGMGFPEMIIPRGESLWRLRRFRMSAEWDS
jgi:hypothetical protein